MGVGGGAMASRPLQQRGDDGDGEGGGGDRRYTQARLDAMLPNDSRGW
jgi:hypothetical protein